MESSQANAGGVGDSSHPAVGVPTGLDIDGPWAFAGGRWWWGQPELSDDPGVLDGSGTWIVCVPAEGSLIAARFPHSVAATPSASPPSPPTVDGPGSVWKSSLELVGYTHRVAAIRGRIADGDVYQVNLTLRLAGPRRNDHPGASAMALTVALATTQRAPFAASLCLPELGVWVVGASPERFLRRDGDLVVSEPIKGTAPTAAGLTAKDRAENVMICDLVRNDLGRVCRPGTIEVPDLLRVEPHPGLVHLVTTVAGRLRPEVGWGQLLAATFPPGSVTGAPKLAALEVIDRMEPLGRGPYCGALGWVDADAQRADLAVSIRTFWAAGNGSPHWRWTFGTGGAITWDSLAADEWAETELKADRLLRIAATPLDTTGGPLGVEDPAPRTW
ncbi:MAG: anthranilate synthase component I family protein [Microthrixaceae bacterium]|nr:anthranilate synthase component I family protein [Microthrixaceae bacterium]